MRFKTLAVIVAFLACVSIGKAEILNWYCNEDGDGVVKDTITSWYDNTLTGEYEMTINTRQDIWDYGHMIGWFVSDGDPRIKVINSISNDTGAPWTDYHINLYMDRPFTIVPNSALVITPGDWNPNSVITPVNTTPGSYTDADGRTFAYKGSIDYYAGSPVLSFPPDDELEFVYKIDYNYVGTINYTQEMIPTPEPGTFVMLACGLLSLFVIRRRFA